MQVSYPLPPAPNQLKGVGVQNGRLVMNQVESLDCLRMWESQDVQQIRTLYEQTQKMLEEVRRLDQSSLDQSQAQGEVAVLNHLHCLSQRTSGEMTRRERTTISALIRATGEARISTSHSQVRESYKDDFKFEDRVGRYPGGEYVVTADGTWEVKLPKMEARLDLQNGLLSWRTTR